MNKVITINLGGTAYQLEEGGYDVLRAYLETAAARLQGNPDKDEILSDIEWAIAEKFRPLLGNHKTVVVTEEVSAVLADMGPIEAGAGEAAKPGTGAPGSAPGAAGTAAAKEAGATSEGGGTPKRLYRISEGAMLAGVANGLASYFHIDPTLVRLAFVFLTLLWGAGLVAYVIMAIVVPEARSAGERAAAAGEPSTAQEFIRRAKEGYYQAMKGLPARQARYRQWQRRFRRAMRTNTRMWRGNWFGCRAMPGPVSVPVYAGSGLGLPLFSLLHGAATVLMSCALVSLLANGTLFGAALPANLPVWVALVLACVIHAAFTWPLRAARRMCHWGLSQQGAAGSLVFILDTVVWLTVVAALVLLGAHFFPEFREAVQNAPIVAHQASTDIQNWSNQK